MIEIVRTVLDLQATFALEKDKGEETKGQIRDKVTQAFKNP